MRTVGEEELKEKTILNGMSEIRKKYLRSRDDWATENNCHREIINFLLSHGYVKLDERIGFPIIEGFSKVYTDELYRRGYRLVMGQRACG